MRTILRDEIRKERCNAAALGAYNASVEEHHFNNIINEGWDDLEMKIHAAKELRHNKISIPIVIKQNNKLTTHGGYIESKGEEKASRIIIGKGGLDRGVIAHEMKHIKQSQNKELLVREGNVYWKGKKYISVKSFNKITKNLSNPVNYFKYKNFPWEVEAYNRQVKLSKRK